jgi:hypothetical protein
MSLRKTPNHKGFGFEAPNEGFGYHNLPIGSKGQKVMVGTDATSLQVSMSHSSYYGKNSHKCEVHGVLMDNMTALI